MLYEKSGTAGRMNNTPGGRTTQRLILFYGYRSRVRFAAKFEAIAAYLGPHSEMIHLIRVITFISDAVYCGQLSLLFRAENLEELNEL